MYAQDHRSKSLASRLDKASSMADLVTADIFDAGSSSKIPACVLKARALIASKGEPITHYSVSKHLDKKEIDKLLWVMRRKIKWVPGQVSSRLLLAKFIIEPNLAKNDMFNMASKSSESGTRGRKMWLTIMQMAHPMMYESMEGAEGRLA